MCNEKCCCLQSVIRWTRCTSRGSRHQSTSTPVFSCHISRCKKQSSTTAHRTTPEVGQSVSLSHFAPCPLARVAVESGYLTTSASGTSLSHQIKSNRIYLFQLFCIARLHSGPEMYIFYMFIMDVFYIHKINAMKISDTIK